MSPAIRTAIFLSLALIPPSTATAQDPEARVGLGANAAMKYWQAFALLPPLDKDQEQLLERWNKAPLDAMALELIEKSLGSREYLHRGAALPRCDWSLDYEDGIFLRLPYLSKARTLALLAALHARQEFAQGHLEAGWQDVTDLLKLARQVESVPVQIVQLVGYVIETTAIEAAAPYLPALKSVRPEAALDALPPRPTLRQMVLMERQLGPMWLIRELKEAERRKEGSWQEVWKRIFDVIIRISEGQDVPDRDFIQSVKTFEQAISTLEGLLTLYDELARMTDLPAKEFDARYAAFIEKARSANPLAALGLSSMGKFVEAERRAQTRMALFRAALAVVQGGPDRLKDIKDPFGDGPFEYRASGEGFELKSKRLHQGKPVTLTVGQRTKP
jgi:hypothetical protein